MGAFFILLFWILWFGIKWLDNGKPYGWDEMKRIDDIIKLPIDDTSHTRPKTPDEAKALCESVSDDLAYIFGDDWRVFREHYRPWFNNPNYMHYGDYGFSSLADVAYKVWLSKCGYVPWQCFGQYFLEIHGYMQPEIMDEMRAIALRAYQVIERNLREAHPDFNLTLRARVHQETGEEEPYWLAWEHFQKVMCKKLGRRPW